MNSKIIKIVSVLLSVFIIIYVGVQAFYFFYSPYEAETVFRTTVNNSLKTQALVFRDETMLDAEKGGILNYRVQNGGKVAQKSVIADKYSTEQDMLFQNRIEQIEAEIAVLTEAQKKGATAAATLDSLTNQINEEYLELMGAVNQQNYSELSDYRLKLQELFCKKQIVIGKATDFTARISELEQQKKQLRDSISAEPASIISPESGYFAQTVDGLEKQYPCEKADTLTIEELSGIFESAESSPVQQDDTKIGKIIASFEWKLAILVDAVDAPMLTKGKTVDLIFPSFGSTTYRATVTKADFSRDGKQSIVIFDCNVMDSTITQLRIEDVEIVLSTVTGIQIPKEAIRYNENNEIGAYEKIGQKLYFRKIDLLYEADDYVISKIRDEEDTKHEYVHVYDDVVIKGKDLYDEKPIS